MATFQQIDDDTPPCSLRATCCGSFASCFNLELFGCISSAIVGGLVGAGIGFGAGTLSGPVTGAIGLVMGCVVGAWFAAKGFMDYGYEEVDQANSFNFSNSNNSKGIMAGVVVGIGSAIPTYISASQGATSVMSAVSAGCVGALTMAGATSLIAPLAYNIGNLFGLFCKPKQEKRTAAPENITENSPRTSRHAR